MYNREAQYVDIAVEAEVTENGNGAPVTLPEPPKAIGEAQPECQPEPPEEEMPVEPPMPDAPDDDDPPF